MSVANRYTEMQGFLACKLKGYRPDSKKCLWDKNVLMTEDGARGRKNSSGTNLGSFSWSEGPSARKRESLESTVQVLSQLGKNEIFVGKVGCILRKVVPGAGLEPARDIIPGDFKSPVSTDSTTRASRSIFYSRRSASYFSHNQCCALNRFVALGLLSFATLVLRERRTTPASRSIFL